MTNESTITTDQMNREARVRLISGLETKGAHLTFEDAVKDFPDNLINENPPHVPYSFWYQLEHIRMAQKDMIEYIKDPEHVSPDWPRGYWPEGNAKTDRGGWRGTIDRYLADRREFVDLISDPKTNLLAPVKHMSNRSIMRCALIIIDHNAYHLGEFVMGRQILDAWKSELG